ncbi:gene transfer agent family protein [Novosphingobium sp. FGD1]|uniref:Gene transfer agent family protein n=1 Tax=Novosphingobium silvae TaxID=2692619 RepID=A0A7X4K6V4_9SPHN|nr:gene transfer agent family protein [Novosphingobium silvae]MYL98406.1 gene transfer agent family protein [Novosphingobium silvae]
MNPSQSRSAVLENVFVGEGYFDLALRIGELITLQEKTRVGPYVLAQRLGTGEWHVEDIIETVRLALIGGGMDNKSAFDLVSRNITAGNLMTYATIAHEVIFAAIVGVDDEVIEQDDDGENDDPFPEAPMD